MLAARGNGFRHARDLLGQLVNLFRDGEGHAHVNGRDDHVRGLIDEGGMDATRYLMLAKSPANPSTSTSVAKKTSNPVYYVQYARICSIHQAADPIPEAARTATCSDGRAGPSKADPGERISRRSRARVRAGADAQDGRLRPLVSGGSRPAFRLTHYAQDLASLPFVLHELPARRRL